METIVKGKLGYNLFENNFNSMEPNIENNINGEDDIGEPLTGNTEGR